MVVSAFDSYLSIKYSEDLYALEENPVGRWLMEADGGDVSLFMFAKFLGTWIAFYLCILVFLYKRRLGILAALGVCTAQIVLLFYLVSG